MNCCFEPGQVLVVPRNGPVTQLAGLLGDVGVARLDVMYSVGDVLQHYRLDPPVLKLPASLPAVVRVPVGDEEAVSARLRGYSSDFTVAIPNFRVRPMLSGLKYNEDVLGDSLAGCGLEPVAGTTCGTGVRIALLDTGVEPTAFASPLVRQYDTDVPRDPATGLVPHDPVGHGTVIARIIRRGAPAAELLPIKVMTDGGNLMSVVSGLYTAMAATGPDIFNLSLSLTCDLGACGVCGTPVTTPVTLEQLALLFRQVDDVYAANSRPAPLLVAAAGNSAPGGHVAIPAAFEGVLAVGAVRSARDSTIAGYSQYLQIPRTRFVRAPGGEDADNACFAQFPAGASDARWHGRRFFGTSFATGLVTAIAARYLCARGGGMCSGRQTDVPSRQFVLDALAAAALKQGVAVDEALFGLGLARYDHVAALAVNDTESR